MTNFVHPAVCQPKKHLPTLSERRDKTTKKELKKIQQDSNCDVH